MGYRLTALLGLVISSAVLADFTIYIGKSNDITDVGVTFSSSEMQVHDHAPLSCSDMGHAVSISASTNNDASKGRWACDGCNAKAPRDWIIDRFEMYNHHDAVGHSTSHPVPLSRSAIRHWEWTVFTCTSDLVPNEALYDSWG